MECVSALFSKQDPHPLQRGPAHGLALEDVLQRVLAQPSALYRIPPGVAAL
jgi:hypothetical protein